MFLTQGNRNYAICTYYSPDGLVWGLSKQITLRGFVSCFGQGKTARWVLKHAAWASVRWRVNSSGSIWELLLHVGWCSIFVPQQIDFFDHLNPQIWIIFQSRYLSQLLSFYTIVNVLWNGSILHHPEQVNIASLQTNTSLWSSRSVLSFLIFCHHVLQTGNGGATNDERNEKAC